ncbi:SDR family oxidoreductase [Paraburkholderia sediminicola]|uniref:SDR family oxidoreductase n=1 Tax=Paraburkholderia sediminicola TaxID=458836 RepID=UPI0038BC66BE
MSKKILITGASSGFGRGAAMELARRAHEVVATAETWPQVRSLRADAASAGVKLEVIKLNLLDEIDIAHAAGYDPDVLVLNAGAMESGSIIDIPMERVRESFEINVFGHMKLAQGIVPKMVARKSGKVVWTSSMGGILVIPFVGVYCATKHAIEGIAGAMKAELAPYGVKVATVNPGVFGTGFNDTGAESHVQWYDARPRRRSHVRLRGRSRESVRPAGHDRRDGRDHSGRGASLSHDAPRRHDHRRQAVAGNGVDPECLNSRSNRPFALWPRVTPPRKRPA